MRTLLETKSEYSMQGYSGLPLSELDKARWEFELELALEEYKWIRSEIERISFEIGVGLFGEAWR